MKLSFVIPAYNEQDYIGPCLKSVLADIERCGSNCEVIVVNNASTDRTREVVAGFPGVKIVDEPQKGLVKARAAGFKASTGDLIANVDSDAELPPGWTAKVFAEFARDPNLVALSGPYIYKGIPCLGRLVVHVYYDFAILNHLIGHYGLKNGAVLQGGNYVVRREAMEKIGGFNDAFDFYGEDSDVACRIQKVGRVKFTRSLPMFTSSRRFDGEGYIRAGWKYIINYFWTIFFRKPLTKTEQDYRAKPPAKK